MSFGKWKPIKSSIEGLAFKENQQVSFKHNKKQVVGTIVTLLNNSAVVTLSMDKVIATSEKTVINYKNLVAI
ncbi:MULTISPECIES: hypothetical protein [Enterococcus]|uniref:DUF2187 domain-containing protein n=1 Tax=Enterococcus faecium TaxID=1352 RepID=A0A0D5MBD7_ENTFC|nr:MULTISPECIES: hypothetical protein [Enterococcus]AJY53590.1 hypothetical protein pEfm12493_106 [Enterococcus faecium]MEC3942616.1 hypothetical protein [Enterococcus mundtii]